MSHSLRRLAASLLFVVVALPVLAAKKTSSNNSAPAPKKEESIFKGMAWREVGPYRGGRVAAVTGIPSQRNIYYFGGTGGGVWKTVDGGQTWQNVTDGFFGGSMGAVAVSESDPNVVYAGEGEETLRGNVSDGHGMWRSTDAGKSWTKLGLEESRHIGRIRVDPRNPDLVYVAVIGNIWKPSEMRGVYRSKDGGRTWEKVLYANDSAGAVDLILDPSNPRILYASTWRFRRTPYTFESGGEGSALWKSTDGGDNWKKLSDNKGFPTGTLGIIGVTVSRSNPQNVYAIVEANEGGVFRSRDGGETWQKTNDSRDLRQRAWYYSRIYADPKDEDTVYVCNVRFHKSKDGGKTFSQIRTPHGDNHDLWIDPNDPLRMIQSNDGGVNVSLDGGASWTAQDNQPTAQFYRVSTDNDFPYRILGAQQDNSAVRIRSRAIGPGIGPRDWEETAGGESGYIDADPRDPDTVYGGSYNGLLTVFNHRTEQQRDVNPWPDIPMGHGAEDAPERFQWNFPMKFSPNDPSMLYVASQHLFRSTNGGASWERISDDLTRNDKSKQGPAGGPITKDNTSVEYYDTIFAIAESPLEAGVIWAGSDDGLVHVTRDGGKTWTNVTPKGIPDWIQINEIDASPWDKGGAYVAATMYRSGDDHPYLYKTSDYGETWTKIVDGIPSDFFTRVVRADPARRGLLFAGTERGIFMSFDDGAHWQSAQLNLPIVPVTDLAFKNGDLIAATQGRAFWALDDLTPIEQYSSDVVQKDAFLVTPAPVFRLETFAAERAPKNYGTNPPSGAVIDYFLKNPHKGTKVKVEFLTADGKLIRDFNGEYAEPKPSEQPKTSAASEKPDTKQPSPPNAEAKQSTELKSTEEVGAGEQQKAEAEADEDAEKEPKVPVASGVNRFAWNLRYPSAKKFKGLILWGRGGLEGPRIVPGRYQVRLTAGGQTMTAPFEVRQDPRSKVSQADLQSQFDFLMSIHDKLSEIHDQISRIRDVRAQITDVKKRAKDQKDIADAANALDKKMTAIEEALYQTKNRSNQDPLNFPIRLNDKLATLAETASTGEFAPTAQALAVRQQLFAAVDAELAKLKGIWTTDVPAFNATVQKAAIPAVIFKDEKK